MSALDQIDKLTRDWPNGLNSEGMRALRRMVEEAKGEVGVEFGYAEPDREGGWAGLVPDANWRPHPPPAPGPPGFVRVRRYVTPWTEVDQ